MPPHSAGTVNRSDSAIDESPHYNKQGDLSDNDQRNAEHELDVPCLVVNHQHGYEHGDASAERRKQQQNALADSVFVFNGAAFVADGQDYCDYADNRKVKQKINHSITEVENFEIKRNCSDCHQYFVIRGVCGFQRSDSRNRTRAVGRACKGSGGNG